MNTEDAVSQVIKWLFEISVTQSLCIWSDGKCAPLSPAGWNPLINIKTPPPKFEIGFVDLGIPLQAQFEQAVKDKNVRERVKRKFKINRIPIESLHPFPPEEIH